MGKKDAKQEHYQVKEAKKKCSMNCTTRSEVWVVTRGVWSAERAGWREWSFLFERVLKTWSQEGSLLFFVG